MEGELKGRKSERREKTKRGKTEAKGGADVMEWVGIGGHGHGGGQGPESKSARVTRF